MHTLGYITACTMLLVASKQGIAQAMLYRSNTPKGIQLLLWYNEMPSVVYSGPDRYYSMHLIGEVYIT